MLRSLLVGTAVSCASAGAVTHIKHACKQHEMEAGGVFRDTTVHTSKRLRCFILPLSSLCRMSQPPRPRWSVVPPRSSLYISWRRLVPLALF